MQMNTDQALDVVRQAAALKPTGLQLPAKVRQGLARLRADLLAEQTAFIDDPSLKKAALCTRRAGKTFAIAANLLLSANEAAENTCFYFAITKHEAKKLMWRGRSGLIALDRKYGLGTKFHHGEVIATAASGALIYISGAETEADIEKYRGEPYKLTCIDESQSYKPHLEQLVFEVLEPASIDLDGTMVLTGTPGKVLAGTFYDVTRQEGARRPGWSVHEWSIFQNTHIRGEEGVARIFESNEWDPANLPPKALREYRGLWIRDDDTLVYNYDVGVNGWDGTLPADLEWEYILGVDIGWNDATAFRVIAFNRRHKFAYLVEGWKGQHLTPEQIAERIKGTRKMPWYNSEYEGPVIEGYKERFDILKIVADTGGLGKMVVEGINDRYLLGIHPAEKVAKLDFIELMNDDLRAGRLKVKPGDPVIEEWSRLQWAEDETKREEDPRQPNDLSDATLYAWREARHYWAEAAEPEPEVGTDEYNEQQEAKIMVALEKEAKRRQGSQTGNWWEQ